VDGKHLARSCSKNEKQQSGGKWEGGGKKTDEDEPAKDLPWGDEKKKGVDRLGRASPALGAEGRIKTIVSKVATMQKKRERRGKGG